MLAIVTESPQVVAAKHSLLDVANLVSLSSDRWENGVTFTPVHCDAGRVLATNCPAPETPTELDCTEAIEFKPFVLEITYAWSTIDLAADPKAIAMNALDVASSRLIERTLWTGDTLDPTNPAATVNHPDIHQLSDATDLGSEADAISALSAVLTALADSTTYLAGTSTIHMNTTLAVELTAGTALTVGADGSLHTTVGMNPVIVGDYPDNAIVGHLGNLDVYLGEPFVVEYNVRDKNERLVLVERLALVAYNSCTAVKASVSGS